MSSVFDDPDIVDVVFDFFDNSFSDVFFDFLELSVFEFSCSDDFDIFFLKLFFLCYLEKIII